MENEKKYGSEVMMSCINKKLLGLTAAVALFAANALPASAAPASNMIMMNNVTPSMLSADYWLGDSGDKILLGSEGIDAANNANYNTPETCMVRLAAEPDTYDGIALRDSLASFEDPKGLFLHAKPVTAAYYETIRKNIAGTKAQSDMHVGYGIMSSRDVMKNLPTMDDLSDDVTDPEWDNTALSAIMIGEPVLTYVQTADGMFTYVKGTICSGWVRTDSVALCKDKAEWLDLQQPDDFVIVTGEDVHLEESRACPAVSELSLEMGTKLRLSDKTGGVNNRMSWYNYVVDMPVRASDGSLTIVPVMIPANRDVHVGYLPFTQKNLLTQAMKALGNRYGWGGSLHAQDCSGYVRQVYLCFGMELARNTTWQAAMPVRRIDLAGLSSEAKSAILREVPAGAILQFPGHEMLYLGAEGDDFYTINDVSSLAMINDETGKLTKMRGRCVVINGLKDTKRTNGKSWFDQLTRVIIPWEK